MNTVRNQLPAVATWLSYFSLFTSLSTLLCCALPSVLVLLGLGRTVASALSSLPWLVSLSRHKAWTLHFGSPDRDEFCEYVLPGAAP